MQEFSSADIAAADAALDRLDTSAIHHAFDVQGCRMVWREWGRGPALVLIHGGHGSWMHWAKNIDVLAEHFRVLIPDMPGFGDSEDFDMPPYDPDRVERLLETLTQGIARLVGTAPLYLTGFSFGGAIAGALAPRLPTLQRLALLGSAGHGGPRRDREPLSDWRAVTGQEREQAFAQNLRAFMLSFRHTVNALALQIHARSCEKTRFRSKSISRRSSLLDVLKDFDKPILMAWGEDDVTAVPADAGRMLAQGHPSREWHVIADSGHWVQFEQADAVNALLIRWFAPPAAVGARSA
ncbi:alpha/beta fold hydrolase [Bordetella genomosp. 4]|uniref:AB hydrolase-1 domain-containing protein n=1 Tax=Bordetella genomosp. 4 TaxID=463044 RepID=A0A261U361_9BORD|nr:alpha/beta hydrolase [Bordetella genomosp. 4]OZI49485.1 hypothetical protein CAL21_07880 [Bordetella genomosp. 4]OZI55927.1 hypothetical protein CAL20_10710 [Bordetella genomosp. 4]